ncbi:MAG: hypothetical protein HY826_04450 [Actinobacteria bacterium]|nr:hypothetical protein [Actinomycetota bacterium]
MTHMAIDFGDVEAFIARAIRSRSTADLPLLGHGEISVVLAWPADEPVAAVKRVPPFRDREAAQKYVDVCAEFFDTLRNAEVAAWPTMVHIHVRDDDRAVVYHQQPIADLAQLGSNVMRAAPLADSHPLLDAIIEAAARVCNPTLGFDCQLANWLWDGNTATQLDFTSPFALTVDRDDLRYDAHAFLQEYPLVIRPYLKKEFTSLIRRFTKAEGALTDMVANMMKEGLDEWVEPAINAINLQLGSNVTRVKVQRMYDHDRKLMPSVLKLKKAQRWWLTHTGRRYEQLLPVRTTYHE